MLYRITNVLCFAFCGSVGLGTAIGLGTLRAADPAPSPLAVFEQRIMPIFASPKPSSCVQCHLSSVDLKNYILPSSEATFLALRKDGLINVAVPQDSKILKLIVMGEQDADAGAKLIHARTRAAEYEAFAAWIEACCHDTELLAADQESSEQAVGPTKPLDVVRHNRKDRLLDSFVRNVWSQRMRCFPCHTPHEIKIDNPQHQNPSQRHAEYVAEYGQKMNLFLETPEQTLRAWMANSRKSRGDHLPLINIETPAESLIVLKPTAQLPAKGADGKLTAPSSALPVSHMGGLKMFVNDHSYKAFLSWINDYAKVVRDEYQQATDLPRDNWYPTEQFLKITNAPEAWAPLSTVQMFVFAWNADSAQWEEQPVAFTQSLVTPRHITQGPLFLLSTEKSQESETQPAERQLAAGKYLVRVCVDQDHVLDADPSLMLYQAGAAFPTAQFEAKWNTGFKNAETIDGGQLH